MTHIGKKFAFGPAGCFCILFGRFQLLRGQFFLGNILSNPDSFNRFADFIKNRMALSPDRSFHTIRTHNPVFHGKFFAIGQEFPMRLLQHLPVIRMNEAFCDYLKIIIKGFFRINAEQPEHFTGPLCPIGGNIQCPAPNVADFLSIFKGLPSLLQVFVGFEKFSRAFLNPPFQCFICLMQGSLGKLLLS